MTVPLGIAETNSPRRPMSTNAVCSVPAGTMTVSPSATSNDSLPITAVTEPETSWYTSS
jgi:hypothetical protein